MVTSADVQRLFLQAILSRGLISGKLARVLWLKCIDAVKATDESVDYPHTRGQEDWDAFLARVNKSIDNLDLEFRQIHDEASGREMYALVNRKGDEIAQMATDYSPAEIVYFKAIVEQIMLAPNESYCVSSLAALREVHAIKPKSNMSKAQAEVVLGSFVAKGWLLKTTQGRYRLSTRTLLELQGYLKTTYMDEYTECTICTEVLTRGIACYTRNCKTRMHTHCFTTFRRRRSACPMCAVEWPREPNEKPLLPVGEGAVKDGEDSERRTRMKENEDSDEDESMDDAPATPAQAKTQRSQRTSKGRQTDVFVDDEEVPRQSQPKRRSSRR